MNEKDLPHRAGLSSSKRGVRHCRSSAADTCPRFSSLSMVALRSVCKSCFWRQPLEEVTFISAERLKTYDRLTDKRKKAIALHNHTLQLGASLMSMIALLELSLRNSTNQRLIEDFGDANWLVRGSTTLPLRPTERQAISRATSQAKKAAYAKLNHKEKTWMDAFAFPAGVPAGWSHERRAKERQAQFVVSHGQIVSQTTLFFWKRLYSPQYEADLWKPSLKRIFPNKSLKRGDVAQSLEVIYATRNRVAHHEPVYGQRLVEAMNALDFVRNSLGAKRNDDETPFKKFSRVQYLRLRMDHEAFVEAWHTLT